MPLTLAAQDFRSLPEKLFPEQDTTKIYTVGGYRHGISFFPKVKIGEHIKKGDLLLSFDLERIRKNDCCTLISVVLPEYTGTPVVPPEHWPVAAGDPLFGL